MKKGFTLMEILAVLLIIAVIGGFALPALKSVRAEIRHHQAKVAALKMAEAMRAFYQNTRGYLITGSIAGTNVSKIGSNCTLSGELMGIPAEVSSSAKTKNIQVLFECNYLSAKDFIGVPYTFTAASNPFGTNVLLQVVGTGKAAGRYQDKSFKVYRDMSVEESI